MWFWLKNDAWKIIVILFMRICNTGWLYNSFLKCLRAEAVPFIDAYFPIFARASSACAVALRFRLDRSCRYRSSTSTTNIAHSTTYKLEIDVNQATDHGNESEYNHSTGYDVR